MANTVNLYVMSRLIWIYTVCRGTCIRVSLHYKKHAYSNLLKISPPKTESFPKKKSDSFHISSQNIDCGTRLNRLAEAVLMSTHNLFLSRNKKNNCYPCKTKVLLYKSGV